ncbi:MAG: sigma-70 family RNA polymerase sigma factor [Candidatus Pacebacteria bacterium]|nr:sigma-70 family RNA polymerase sigma factor [Candidatus Paceibacterota bacterium]
MAFPESFRSEDGNGPWISLDLTEIYFYQAHQYPLLTAEEEVRLADLRDRGIEAGRRLKQEPDLEAGEREALFARQEEGSKAFRALIRANLLLVAKIAAGYWRLDEYPDLIQAGNEGLVLAAGKYDPGRGFRFSTYAALAIKREIWDYLRRSESIPLTLTDFREVRKLQQEQDSALQKLGREMNLAELADKFGWSLEKTLTLLRLSNGQIASLDWSWKDGDKDASPSLYDFLSDDSQDLERKAAEAYWQGKLPDFLRQAGLSRRDLLVLQYLLIDGKTQTAAAELLGITQERVGELLRKAMGRLFSLASRSPGFRACLNDFGLWPDEDDGDTGSQIGSDAGKGSQSQFPSGDSEKRVTDFFFSQAGLTPEETEVAKLILLDRLIPDEVFRRLNPGKTPNRHLIDEIVEIEEIIIGKLNALLSKHPEYSNTLHQLLS